MLADSQDWLAEGEGFEPPVRLPAQRVSRPPHSTTLASLRRQAPWLTAQASYRVGAAGTRSLARVVRGRVASGGFRRRSWGGLRRVKWFRGGRQREIP